jgi:hypothetical protein
MIYYPTMTTKRNRRNTWHAIADGIVRFLGSERFFQIILGIFILQALWFVFTAQYPMAFDEAFHFGLIKLHAQQWMPFFTHQPPGAAAYGAVARDPSYLYHYLMSWPYRLISAITSNQTQQIIFLRLINVAMSIYGIVLFRRLLARLGGSRALNHTALLIYTLLPITAFLAATINYDNLFILVSTWSLLATFVWFDALRKRQISVARTTILLCVIILACLIKYAFLPITAAIVLFMAWQLWRAKADWPELRVACKQGFQKLSRLKVVGLILFVLVSLFLFTERYGINLVRYHELNINCGSVLSVQSCSQYGPWARNHGYILGKSATFKPRVLWYVGDWIAGMWRRIFFAINYNYANKWPLPIPSITTIVLGIGSSLVFIFAGWKVLRKRPYRQVAALAMVLYVGALFMQDFQGYVQTGVAVAVNGRYLLPFMPIILVFAGLGIRQYWRKFQVLKPFVAVVVILLFLQGGGVLTFIVQSDKSWDWPNQGVVDVNNAARTVLQPFIVGSRNKN